jgi:predicted DCC family thiol-disulfide oxidoreductase YuxK
MIQQPDRLILYDPLCNLCTGVVQYLLKHDRKQLFFYGSLFSKQGKQVKKKLSWAQQKNTIIYLEDDRVFTQSDAAIRILSLLPGLHRLFVVLRVFPKPLRDGVYKIIAKYRYRWFGKRTSPFRPAAEFKEKFIDFDEAS